MKKIAALLLVLFICLNVICPAIAEEFSIHSGVKFGMTMEEVMNAEKNAGFQVAKDSLSDLSLGYNCKELHSDICLSVNGKIAGVDGANITYHFDKTTGSLVGALYVLGINRDVSFYETFRETLVKKYGKADTSLSEIWHTLLKLDSFSNADYFGNMGANITYLYNDAWLLPQEDGNYVAISGVYYVLSVGKNRLTYTLIDYQYFEKEVIDGVLSSFAEAVENYNSQLENDL